MEIFGFELNDEVLWPALGLYIIIGAGMWFMMQYWKSQGMLVSWSTILIFYVVFLPIDYGVVSFYVNR